jgi:hypothetical protein
LDFFLFLELIRMHPQIERHHKWLHGLLRFQISLLQDWEDYEYWKQKEARRRFKCEEENSLDEKPGESWFLQALGSNIISNYGTEDIARRHQCVLWRCGVDSEIWAEGINTIGSTTKQRISPIDKLILRNDYRKPLRMTKAN